MLSRKNIKEIAQEVSKRPLSEKAALVLENGCKKYRLSSERLLKRKPTKDEATKFVKQVFSKIKAFAPLELQKEEITAQEVKKFCDKLPYPFNLWFC